MGQMSGRAAGYCAGYSQPGFMNPAGGRGYGGGGYGWGRGGGWGGGGGRGRGNGWGGRGGGWGRRNQYYAGQAGWRGEGMNQPYYPMPPAVPFVPTITREQELSALKQQSEYLETSLNEVKRMIQEMESVKEDES